MVNQLPPSGSVNSARWLRYITATIHLPFRGIVVYSNSNVIITTYISFSAPVKRLYPYEGDTLIDFKVKCEKIQIPRGGIRFYGKRHRKCFVCNIMKRFFSDSQFVIDRDISVSAYCFSSIDYVTLLSDNTL